MPPRAAVIALPLALLCASCSDEETALAPVASRCAPSLLEATEGACLGEPDAELPLSGLKGEVRVLRDGTGMAHIYARHFEDAFLAQGYLAASDRFIQMELLRRLAGGRLAEILSDADPSLAAQDALYRVIGLERVARAQLEGFPPNSEERRLLDAYASGVTQWIDALKRGEASLPKEIVGLTPSQFRPWTAVDSLLVARFQAFVLSETVETELDATETAAALRTVFRADAANADLAARAGFVRDVFRFAPADPATPLLGFPGAGSEAPRSPRPDLASRGARATEPPLTKALAASRSTRDVLATSKRLLGLDRRDVGSNNWAVSGALTTSGYPMLASDPHLPLSSPAVLWPTHLVVESDGRPQEDLDVAGMAFPGIPGVILGFNRHVAWGATVAFFDVTDVYFETLNADATAVVHDGAEVAVEAFVETVDLADGDDVDVVVKIVPHHGPILPSFGPDHRPLPLDPKVGALSVRWTGFEPTRELSSVLALWRARDVADAKEALREWGPGAQNWVFADDGGNLLYSAQARIPTREAGAFGWDAQSFSGQLPCFVQSGQGGAEWTGFLQEAYVPQALNPSAGFIATANADQVGTTLDNDPGNDTLPNGERGFLSCFYDIGFRQGRINQRLATVEPRSMTLEAMAELQADHRSPLGARLVPRLLSILTLAEQERVGPGTHPELSAVVQSARYQNAAVAEVMTWLASWRDQADYRAESGVDPHDGAALSDDTHAAKATLVFNAFLTRLLARVFADETAQVPVENSSFSPQRGFVDPIALRALLHLLESDPASLATYDPKLGDSRVWDDLNTPVTETRAERFVIALLDGLQGLEKSLGSDRTAWRWGHAHRVTFAPAVPLWFVHIPALDHPVFAGGFPRHGDLHVVDASNYDVRRGLAEELGFGYRSGPAQRFVIEMDPSGPRAMNALPGGVSGDPRSAHFADGAELWRRNQNRPVPFSARDVLAEVEASVALVPQAPAQ